MWFALNNTTIILHGYLESIIVISMAIWSWWSTLWVRRHRHRRLVSWQKYVPRQAISAEYCKRRSSKIGCVERCPQTWRFAFAARKSIGSPQGWPWRLSQYSCEWWIPLRCASGTLANYFSMEWWRSRCFIGRLSLKRCSCFLKTVSPLIPAKSCWKNSSTRLGYHR